jgi:hypothetical protein
LSQIGLEASPTTPHRSWQGWMPMEGLGGSDSIWTGTGVIASLPDGSSQVFATQLSNFDTAYENKGQRRHWPRT